MIPAPGRPVMVACNAQNRRVGVSNPKARHADELVEQAKQLRSVGRSYRQIGKALGVSRWTARHWAVGDRRNVKPVRYAVKRVRG
jgi:hypothetical protein